MSFVKQLFNVNGDDERENQPTPKQDRQRDQQPTAVTPHEGPAVAGDDLDNQTLPTDTAEPLLKGTFLAEADSQLIAESVITLESVGIITRTGVEHEDLEDALSDDIDLFRRRPLISLMASRDPDGELVFEHVFVDDDNQLRCTTDDLLEFLEEAAIAAGTDAYISNVVVFPDSDDPSQGSLRFQVGEWDVHDVEFVIDPDFGAADAEAALIKAVALDGCTATTFEGAFHRHAVTIWADPTRAETTELVAAINAELKR